VRATCYKAYKTAIGQESEDKISKVFKTSSKRRVIKQRANSEKISESSKRVIDSVGLSF
jgi:hypothetical protein